MAEHRYYGLHVMVNYNRYDKFISHFHHVDEFLFSGNPEAIIALLQAGASRTVVDRNQLGVLHCAASQGHANALHILIQSSEQSLIDSVDRNGDTPLFYAVSLGHYECAKLLLTSGANPNQQVMLLLKFLYFYQLLA